MDYNSISKGYNELHKAEQLKKLEIIRSNLEIRKSDRLLDVGSGTGFSLDFFDCDCTGVEPSKEMAEQSPGKAVIGRAEELPFRDNEFDIVISVTAIHNFSDIRKGLEEMRRVGRGKYAFSVLRKARKFTFIMSLIKELFKVEKEIKEEKDMIFIASRP